MPGYGKGGYLNFADAVGGFMKGMEFSRGLIDAERQRKQQEKLQKQQDTLVEQRQQDHDDREAWMDNFRRVMQLQSNGYEQRPPTQSPFGEKPPEVANIPGAYSLPPTPNFSETPTPQTFTQPTPQEGIYKMFQQDPSGTMQNVAPEVLKTLFARADAPKFGGLPPNYGTFNEATGEIGVQPTIPEKPDKSTVSEYLTRQGPDKNWYFYNVNTKKMLSGAPTPTSEREANLRWLQEDINGINTWVGHGSDGGIVKIGNPVGKKVGLPNWYGTDSTEVVTPGEIEPQLDPNYKIWQDVYEPQGMTWEEFQQALAAKGRANAGK